jgi:hypothetical protein
MAASQLTSALFLDDSPPLPPLSSTFKPVPSSHQSSNPLAGIYIRSQTPEVVKVNIPADCVAFQTGSALGKMTGGELKDVPHFVRGPNAEEYSGEKYFGGVHPTQPRRSRGFEDWNHIRRTIRLSDEKHA